MSEKDTNIIDVDETVAVPVMETDFNELIKIIKLVNIADSVHLISLPKHVSYYNSEKISLETGVKEILGYYNDETEFWRIKEKKIEPLGLENDGVKIFDKTIFDANKIIIISKLNSVFIFPGERSIKEGNCLPNEVIRLINLVATKSFLMQFSDEEDEETKKNKLHVEFIPIGKKTEPVNSDDTKIE